MTSTLAQSSHGHRRSSRRRSSRRSSRKSALRIQHGPLPLPQTGELLAMAALAAAMVLGGGGTTNPLTEALLEPVLALTAALPLILPALSRGLGPVPRQAWTLAGLVLLIPVLQLVPLPPFLWQALPGREAEVAALALTGSSGRWMPWSIAPARTFISLIATIAPVLTFLLMARLERTGRTWACMAIVILGLVSMLLGTLQLSHAGGFTWSLYPYYNMGKLDGFQANHNAQADILSIALMAFGVTCVALLQSSARPALVWTLALAGLGMSAVALLLTGSRMGIALAPLGMVVFGVILWPALRRQIVLPSRKLLGALALALAALLALAGMALVRLPAVAAVMARFSNLEDSRADIWIDTLHAIGGVWPMGGGVGSFPVLFNAAERLEVVRPTLAGRAHCDWLEWTLEAGLPGLLVLAAILGLAGLLAWRAFNRDVRPDRGRRTDILARAQTLFALGSLAQIGLHALADFPMRSMALAVLCAAAVAMLMPLAPATTGSEP